MNVESKMMSSVARVVAFIKEQVQSDLVSQANEGTLKNSKIEIANLKKICHVVESSIQANFIKSSGEIISLASEIQSKIDKP